MYQRVRYGHSAESANYITHRRNILLTRVMEKKMSELKHIESNSEWMQVIKSESESLRSAHEEIRMDMIRESEIPVKKCS